MIFVLRTLVWILIGAAVGGIIYWRIFRPRLLAISQTYPMDRSDPLARLAAKQMLWQVETWRQRVYWSLPITGFIVPMTALFFNVDWLASFSWTLCVVCFISLPVFGGLEGALEDPDETAPDITGLFKYTKRPVERKKR